MANVVSATLLGVDGRRVRVEVHVSNGLPGMTIVGLPDASCRESRDRVRSALLSSGEHVPQRRITVNLAPSNAKKIGTSLDLAIAVGILIAGEKIPLQAADGVAFIGELGLDGSIRGVEGLVPLADVIDVPELVVPLGCASQAGLVGRHRIRSAGTLTELIGALRGISPWPDDPPVEFTAQPAPPDMSDVRGQCLARWAAEVAAAGSHNLLLTGPPGSGKTMLAQRLPSLLPDLGPSDALMTTKIHSAAGLLARDAGLLVRPPFRAPHHSASLVSLIGGGARAMRPGEASLAHGGVLFLDEMCEFPRNVLDALRQPLEEGVVRVSRAAGNFVYPAHFLLVGATNPCPCGEGLVASRCRCSASMRLRYRSRLSGPLLDRFDLRISIDRPKVEQFFMRDENESTTAVAERVAMARKLSLRRGVGCNAELTASQLDRIAPLSPNAERLLVQQMKRGALTARGLYRVRRVALTLSDLEGGHPSLSDAHVSAALQLRPESAKAEVI